MGYQKFKVTEGGGGTIQGEMQGIPGPHCERPGLPNNTRGKRQGYQMLKAIETHDEKHFW
jgi:hypothetical protein